MPGILGNGKAAIDAAYGEAAAISCTLQWRPKMKLYSTPYEAWNPVMDVSRSISMLIFDLNTGWCMLGKVCMSDPKQSKIKVEDTGADHFTEASKIKDTGADREAAARRFVEMQSLSKKVLSYVLIHRPGGSGKSLLDMVPLQWIREAVSMSEKKNVACCHTKLRGEAGETPVMNSATQELQ